MSGLSVLRDRFNTDNFAEYLQQDRVPVTTSAQINQIKKSILYAVEYREALFEEYKGSEQLRKREQHLECENLYEEQADNDIQGIINSTLARMNETGFKESMEQQDADIPLRQDLINALMHDNSNKFEDYFPSNADEPSQRRALYDLYMERFRLDVTKMIAASHTVAAKPTATI